MYAIFLAASVPALVAIELDARLVALGVESHLRFASRPVALVELGRPGSYLESPGASTARYTGTNPKVQSTARVRWSNEFRPRSHDDVHLMCELLGSDRPARLYGATDPRSTARLTLSPLQVRPVEGARLLDAREPGATTQRATIAPASR